MYKIISFNVEPIFFKKHYFGTTMLNINVGMIVCNYISTWNFQFGNMTFG